MMRNFCLLLLLTIGLVSCRAPAPTPVPTPALRTETVSVDGGSYTNTDPAGLASMLKDKDFVLINVHIPYAGEIESTDLFIPFDDIPSHLGELPADKSAKMVLYCRSGSMSDLAARDLVKLGYTNVWNLDGGMNGWSEAGFPVLRKPS